MTNGDDPVEQPKASGWDSLAQDLVAPLKRISKWVQDNPQAIDLFLAYYVRPIEDASAFSQSHLPLISQDDVNVLMRNGWYPPSDVAPMQVSLLARAFEEDPQGANKLLCDRYSSDLDKIEGSLRAKFPERDDILQEAFEAHREGKYNLSVPIFLTQSDGIWRDRSSRNLFSGGVGGAVNDLARVVGDSTTRELALSLLYQDWPLVLSEGKRDSGFAELNRHQILHGEVTGYGTEENGLKAVAFLNFCALVLPDSENESSSLGP